MVKLADTFEVSAYYYDDRKNLFQNLRAISRHPVDSIHITSDIYFLAPWIWRKKVVITIHDIGRFKELKGWKKWVYWWVWLFLPVRFADKIVTVSDYTLNDVINRVSRSVAHKMIRIHNPVPEIFKPAPFPEHRDKPVFLQVGTIHYKNIENTIRGLSGLDCELVIIGRLNGAQVKLLEDHRISYSNFSGLSYEEVYAQYKQCNFVVFLSTYEGFGMPIIEANAVGRPVICSSNSSLPEVAGEAALFVKDEQSVAEIHAAFKQMIESKSLQLDLIQRGFLNIRRYEMDHIVSQYRSMYESLCP